VLKQEINAVLSASRETGWVLEPEAKRLLSLAGIPVPVFAWAKSADEALRFAEETGYPVVAKVVSPLVVHKSDSGGVIVGIADQQELRAAFEGFSAVEGFSGILVEEMVSGIELIIGAKMDFQFGPVILLGMGGTGVEIYGDTTLRMAPLSQRDVESMVKGLKAHRLLEGYRDTEPVNMKELTRMLLAFSDLVMNMVDRIESIDLNPVMCSARACVVADARIMLP
jgi:acyl-CoA synthetase (NDP forming)